MLLRGAEGASVMVEWVVQPVCLAVASKKEEIVDQLNHERKNSTDPGVLKV